VTHPDAILDRYARCWAPPRAVAPAGPALAVAEIEPAPGVLVHATVGLAHTGGVELYLIGRGGPGLADSADLLRVLADHQRAAPLAIDHAVAFGRPWCAGSRCTHALVSTAPPALPGVLRLIPVTRHEVEHLRRHGGALLAARFAEAAPDLLDPKRASIV
jgi:hypothetical protein